jgi:peptidoglycan hydrolase-like protein with peptidoglycan-binding domain
MNIRELLNKLETIENVQLFELTDQEKADLDKMKNLNKRGNTDSTPPVKTETPPVPPVKTETPPVPPVKTETPPVQPANDDDSAVNQLDWIGMGARGPEVEALQQKLKQEGFDLGTFGPNKDGIDGQFGSKTKTALMQFQQKLVDAKKMAPTLPDGKPSVDGYFGPVTAKAAGMPWPVVNENIQLGIANKLLESFGYTDEDWMDNTWDQIKQDASAVGSAAKGAYNWATNGNVGSDISKSASNIAHGAVDMAHGAAKDFRKFVDQPAKNQAKQIAGALRDGWAKYGTTLKDSPEALDAFVRGVANGVTFGAADNVAAELEHLINGTPYANVLQKELQKSRDYEEKHGVASTAGNIGGGAIWGGASIWLELGSQLVAPFVTKRYVIDPANTATMDQLHKQQANALLKEEESADEETQIRTAVTELQTALNRLNPLVKVSGSLSSHDVVALKSAKTKLGTSNDAETLAKLLGFKLGSADVSTLSESEQISRLKNILMQIDEAGGWFGWLQGAEDLLKLGLKAENEVAAKEIVYAAGKTAERGQLAIALEQIGKDGLKLKIPPGGQLKLGDYTFRLNPSTKDWEELSGKDWVPVTNPNKLKAIEVGQTWKASEVKGPSEWYNVADPEQKISIDDLGKRANEYSSGRYASDADPTGMTKKTQITPGYRNIVDYRQKINGIKNPNFKKEVQVPEESILEKDLLQAEEKYKNEVRGKQGQEQNVVARYHNAPDGSRMKGYLGKDWLKDPKDHQWKYRVKTASGKEDWQVEKDLTSITDIEAEFEQRVENKDLSVYVPKNAISPGAARVRQAITAISPTAGAIGRGMQALGRATSGPARALWNLAKDNPKVAAVIGAIAALGAGAYIWGGKGDIETPLPAETPTGLSVKEVDELANLFKKYENSPEPELKAEADKAKETLRKAGVPGF